MRKITSLTGLLLFVILFATACDESGPRTQVIYAATMGSLSKLRYEAQAGRSVPVYAVNAPFQSDADLSQAFAAILKGDDPHLRFEGQGGGIPEGNPRPWVLVLNSTPTGYTGISACQGKPYDPDAKAGAMEIRLIVCNDAARLVEVLAILPEQEAGREAAYDALLRQAARSLLIGEDQTPR